MQSNGDFGRCAIEQGNMATLADGLSESHELSTSRVRVFAYMDPSEGKVARHCAR